MSERETLQQVITAIREAISEDWVNDFEIDMDTSFNDDLEIESIEFVAIADLLQKKFGELNLIDWLSKRDINELIALTVGNVVTFIEDKRR